MKRVLFLDTVNELASLIEPVIDGYIVICVSCLLQGGLVGLVDYPDDDDDEEEEEDEDEDSKEDSLPPSKKSKLNS